MLDIWPALPLSIHANFKDAHADESDIIGTLEHRNRVATIYLWEFNRSQLKKCIALAQEPFPVLRSLDLGAGGMMLYDIPDAFLGGSAPLLRSLRLHDIRFSGLPKLLSSTRDLVNLNLENFPMTGEGHISPDTMATCLSVLSNLRYLTLTFLRQMSSPYPTYQRAPSSTYTVLPTVTYLWLTGPHGYLEDLVGRVDAPLLNYGYLEFYDEPTFDTPRVLRFIHHTKVFKLLGGVGVTFYREHSIRASIISATFRSLIGPVEFSLNFLCSGFPAQVVIMEKLCAQWPPLVSHVELLQLGDNFWKEKKRGEAITQPEWLGFLRPFSAVQTLRLCVGREAPHVTHVMGTLKGKKATEVLPALRTIESEYGCSEQWASEVSRLLVPFLVAREELGRPVVVNLGPRSNSRD